MKWIIVIAALAASMAHAESPYESCRFVSGWASQAFHIAKRIELAEENWRITEDGFEPDEYVAIMQIKYEAYHDLPALKRRVDLACGQKEES